MHNPMIKTVIHKHIDGTTNRKKKKKRKEKKRKKEKRKKGQNQHIGSTAVPNTILIIDDSHMDQNM
jgi:predicted amidophosphoribosyltransferase